MAQTGSNVATTTPEQLTAENLREREPTLFGLVAEYDTVDAVMAAAEKVRDAGYRRWDVHSPFPIHGIDDAMGVRPTILPWIVLAGGIAGGTTGILLTCYTMGIHLEWEWLPESFKGYPFAISGKPLISFPAFIPVIFELTILFSAFGAVFGMFLLNRLPLLAHPLLAHERLRRATDDRFYVVIEARDPNFDGDRTLRLLEETNPLEIEAVDR